MERKFFDIRFSTLSVNQECIFGINERARVRKETWNIQSDSFLKNTCSLTPDYWPTMELLCHPLLLFFSIFAFSRNEVGSLFAHFCIELRIRCLLWLMFQPARLSSYPVKYLNYSLEIKSFCCRVRKRCALPFSTCKLLHFLCAVGRNLIFKI